MLDKLPAWLRHLVLVFAGAGGAVVADAVVNDRGVTNVPWGHTLRVAVDTGSVAAAGVVSALYLLPLTRQYGLGKRP